MQELLRVIEEPRKCSYLPRETASLELRAVTELSPAEYGDLLARGYRRFGWQVFRPACPKCAACRSFRIPVRHFEPNGPERRILRKNANVGAQLHPLFVTREHVDLYNVYQRYMHEHRGWPLQQVTARSYYENFLSCANSANKQWLYWEDDRLVGVALMDEVPGAISLVYCFYDPEWRARSPGTFSILNQLLYAKARQHDYAYLGYWIEDCPSMSYKSRFQPHELLTEHPADNAAPVWTSSAGQVTTRR